ncbi:unnamed protein product [Lasius platythorax]|uniref:Uncharacterized protein n=1 Tax=Lasius platythorax TaxID=488582 RepID=A0AAV2PAK0_9HYME
MLGCSLGAGWSERVCNYLFLGSITPEGRGEWTPSCATVARKAERAPARVANVTGNKNRPSGSRKLQSLQAASTDSETDNMYGRDGEIAGRKRSYVDYSWTIVPRTSSRRQQKMTIDTFWRSKLSARFYRGHL